MTPPIGRRPERARGRRQDQTLDDAILGATRDLLFERGFDNFGTRDVAERAGTGSGAIYRRWSSKQALVAEALDRGPDQTVARSDDPAADLAGLIRDGAARATRHPDLVPGLVAAMRSSPEINNAMQRRHTTQPYREILARLLGPEHPHLDLLAELVPAIIVHRTIFDGPDLDPERFPDEILALLQTISTEPGH